MPQCSSGLACQPLVEFQETSGDRAKSAISDLQATHRGNRQDPTNCARKEDLVGLAQAFRFHKRHFLRFDATAACEIKDGLTASSGSRISPST